MLRTLILSILLCVVASASYATSVPCASPDEIDKYLLSTFKEEKVWVGISSKSDKLSNLLSYTKILSGGESSTYISTKTKGSKL